MTPLSPQGRYIYRDGLGEFERNLIMDRLTTSPRSINLTSMTETTPEPLRIRINEKEIIVPSPVTVLQLRERFKPESDLIIYNGFPVTGDQSVKEGDEIVFIKKGEIPPQEEFECMMMARHTP